MKCVLEGRIFIFLRLEGSQCHAPPQGETGYGKMDDISLLVGPALRRTGVF